jgi:hypothetical protein
MTVHVRFAPKADKRTGLSLSLLCAKSDLTHRSEKGRYSRNPAMSGSGLVSRASPVQTAMRNCTGDEGRPFEFGNQVSISSHRKLLLSKAMVVSVAETPGHDPGRHG